MPSETRALRRLLITAAGLPAIMLMTAAQPTHALAWPAKPIKHVVTFPPGEISNRTAGTSIAHIPY